MTGIVWGDPIAVDGVRPDWLGSYEGNLGYIRGKLDQYGPGLMWTESDIVANRNGWSTVSAIILPADHFAYTAIAKGFTPWGGGSEAPKDWDGSSVMLRAGSIVDKVFSWQHPWDGDQCQQENPYDVIGYHPKPIAQPSPVDTVTITRLDEDTLACLFETYWEMHGAKDSCIKVLQFIGALPKTPTRAERIAKSTNLSLADVERVLAAVEEEG